MDNLDEQFVAATERGDAKLADAPKAEKIVYDAKTKRLKISLQNGVTLIVPTKLIQIFDDAADEEIADVEIAVHGLYLRWKSLDEDLSVPNLVQGIFGTRKWMDDLKTHLSNAGRKGGAARSEVKRRASAENGKNGGRPRKKAAA